MKLDQDRLKSILEAEHSFYGSAPAKARDDNRLNPNPPREGVGLAS